MPDTPRMKRKPVESKPGHTMGRSGWAADSGVAGRGGPSRMGRRRVGAHEKKPYFLLPGHRKLKSSTFVGSTDKESPI